VFLLLRLSAEREFSVALNQPYPNDLPLHFAGFPADGSYGDLLIVVLHKLVGAGSHTIMDKTHDAALMMGPEDFERPLHRAHENKKGRLNYYPRLPPSGGVGARAAGHAAQYHPGGNDSKRKEHQLARHVQHFPGCAALRQPGLLPVSKLSLDLTLPVPGRCC
jgi:hypothetical protein